ncbi:MAG: DUF3429 domain-containing protein [Gammaproteobacteria bacterium]|nr:DUF3429 domain-containing protein [Gammaproteobacteria bacterium]
MDQAARARPNPIARWLGYGGLVPFILPAMVIAVLRPGWMTDTAAQLLLTYGAVILSFLGGVVWGLSLLNGSASNELVKREFIYSVCPSLLAWAALCLPPRLGTGLLALCFCGAFVHDALAARVHELPGWFLSLRLQLSVGAVASLALATVYG